MLVTDAAKMDDLKYAESTVGNGSINLGINKLHCCTKNFKTFYIRLTIQELNVLLR